MNNCKIKSITTVVRASNLLVHPTNTYRSFHSRSVPSIKIPYLSFLLLFIVFKGVCVNRVNSATVISNIRLTHHAFINGTVNLPRNTRILYRTVVIASSPASSISSSQQLRSPSPSQSFLYVTGLNTIYQLDPANLNLIARRISGPRNDSSITLPLTDECGSSFTSIDATQSEVEGAKVHPRDSHVKAWATSTLTNEETADHFKDHILYPVREVVNDDRVARDNALYVCYNLCHGYCERLLLSNISQLAPVWTAPRGLFRFDRPTVIPVVGPFESSFASLVIGSRNLYVGIESDSAMFAYNFIPFFPLTARLRDFQFATRSHLMTGSRVSLRTDQRTTLQYKFSFRYHNPSNRPVEDDNGWTSPISHVYFLVQQINHRLEHWQSAVVRVCDSDSSFNSYVEVTLACNQPTGSDYDKIYSALHTASRGRVGSLLSSLLAQQPNLWLPAGQKRSATLDDNDAEVLVVAFSAQPSDPLMFREGSHHDDVGQSSDDQQPSFLPILPGSALALFSLRQINNLFNNVIAKCVRGEGKRGPLHFFNPDRYNSFYCQDDPYSQFNSRTCPEIFLNKFVMGQEREDLMIAPPFLTLQHDNVTGLVITSVADEFTVVILITDRGQLFKYELQSPSHARLLSQSNVTQKDQPLTGIALDLSGTVAYVTSTSQVYRIELYNCSAALSCRECLQARDPYCGWCIIEGRCSLKSQCPNPWELSFAHNRHRYQSIPPTSIWLSYSNGSESCPRIIQVNPPGLSRRSSIEEDIRPTTGQPTQLLTLSIDRGLAQSLSHWYLILFRDPRRQLDQVAFECSFRTAPSHLNNNPALVAGALSTLEVNQLLADDLEPGRLLTSTYALLDRSVERTEEVRCKPPPLSAFTSLSFNQASLPVIIWLDKVNKSIPGDRSPLAPGLFALYDCSRLTDCWSCVKSRFVCSWCLSADRCVAASNQDGRSGSCITSPLVDHVDLGHDAINTTQNVFYFTCLDNCTQKRTTGTYDLEKSTVTCKLDNQNMAQRFASPSSSSLESTDSITSGVVNCNIELFWHSDDARRQQGHRMVTDRVINVEVYTCTQLASRCDSCLTLPDRFGCGWCWSNSSFCSPRQSCLDSSSPGVDDPSLLPRWLQRPDLCPEPQINSFSPRNSTLTGRTVLELEGFNLGWLPDHIPDCIPIVTTGRRVVVNCQVDKQSYEPSRRFQCQLDSADGDWLANNHSEQSQLQSRGIAGRLHVVIKDDNQLYETFSSEFRFLTPQLTSILPKMGPISGGTLLQIRGVNLNIGANRSAMLVHSRSDSSLYDLKVECKIVSESNSSITCLTGPLPDGRSSILSPASSSLNVFNPLSSSTTPLLTLKLVVMHDQTLSLPDDQSYAFAYWPDPVVKLVSRSNVIASGGTNIMATGQFLFTTASPKIVFYLNDIELISPCQYKIGKLHCTSPSLLPRFISKTPHEDPIDWKLSPNDAESSHQTTSRNIPSNVKERLLPIQSNESNPNLDNFFLPFHIHYGFMMDGAVELLVFGTIQIQPTPMVDPFNSGVLTNHLDEIQSIQLFTSEAPLFVQPDGFNRPINNEFPLYSRLIQRSLLSESPIVSPNNWPPKAQMQLLRIAGQYKALIAAPELAKSDELSISVGSLPCLVNSIVEQEIRCDLDRLDLVEFDLYPVEVKFGSHLVYRPGSVQFIRIRYLTWMTNPRLLIPIGILILVVLVALVAFFFWRHFTRHKRSYQAKIDRQYAEQERRVAVLFRKDLMKLQANMQEFSQEVKKHNLPYRDYRTFILFWLFPDYHREFSRPIDPLSNSSPTLSGEIDRLHCSTTGDQTSNQKGSELTPHPLLSAFTVPAEVHDDMTRAIALFHALLSNRHFLTSLVRAIDEDDQTPARDKSRIASLLCLALQPQMDYLTGVLFDLMADQLQRLHSQGGPGLLATAFRRAETIVDKMISNWLAFLHHAYVKNNIGEHLFYFYRALLSQLNMGPRDATTGKAWYTLDSSTLLQIESKGNVLTLYVEDPQQLFNLSHPSISVRVLDCDSVLQVKEKLLDAVYKNKPYSLQLKPHQLDLVKLIGTGKEIQHRVVSEWNNNERTSQFDSASRPKRVACMSDFEIQDDDHVALVTRLDIATKSALYPPSEDIFTGLGDSVYCYGNSSSPASTHTPTSTNKCDQMTGPRPIGFTNSTRYWYHLERPVSSTDSTRTNGSIASRRNRRRLSNRRLFARSDAVSGDCSYELLPSQLDSTSPSTLDSQRQPIPGVGFKGLFIKRTKRRRRNDDQVGNLVNNLPQELFLTRLLVTRLSVSTYMDKVFEALFSSVIQSQSLPAPIKYLFDFLDDRAVWLDVQDPKIVHAWKSNCLHMRFWNQIITNLDYLFDVPLVRHTAFDRSLHVFSQAVTYACAPTRMDTSADDSSSSSQTKLLFGQDIKRQWKCVDTYYRDIKAMPALTCSEMQSLLCQHSTRHASEFNISWTIYKLYTRYVRRYHSKLVSRLQLASQSPNHHPATSSDSFSSTYQQQNDLINMLQGVKLHFDKASSLLTAPPPHNGRQAS